MYDFVCHYVVVRQSLAPAITPEFCQAIEAYIGGIGLTRQVRFIVFVLKSQSRNNIGICSVCLGEFRIQKKDGTLYKHVMVAATFHALVHTSYLMMLYIALLLARPVIQTSLQRSQLFRATTATITGISSPKWSLLVAMIPEHRCVH